jgi:hypothetical protein
MFPNSKIRLYPLGEWVSNRRRSYKQGSLSWTRIKQLKSLSGLVLGGDPYVFVYEEGLDHLQRYITGNGHANVPPTYKTDDSFVLGKWVSNIQEYYKRKILPSEQIKELESLTGWVWKWVHPPRRHTGRPRGRPAGVSIYVYEKGIDYLRIYIDGNGHARVPLTYKTENDYALGKWVSAKRRLYKEGKLPPEQIKELETLTSWTWTKSESLFQERFIRLKKFVEETGHTKVPHSYKDSDGFKLGIWVANCRTSYRKSKMKQDHILKIESLSGWEWNVSSKKVRQKEKQGVLNFDQSNTG